jgi:RNA polymerase nonessential primary-like sigma factor
MATVKNHTENVNAKFTADMVRTYLREIGRVPLLSREQEIIYGKQVKQMRLRGSQEIHIPRSPQFV